MKHTSQSGIAIFIAVIVVSALLFIAVSISSLSYKEQIISASARDSRVAFFAADSGAECALFHDLKGGNDINNPFVFEIPNESQSGVIVCDPSVGAISTDISTGNPTVTTFFFNLPSSSTCSIVFVEKFLGTDGIETKITSSGYNNTCSVSGQVNEGARNLERTIQISY